MILEQQQRDFEWACSLNPKTHRSNQLRDLASDHHPGADTRDRLRRLQDRRKGIQPMLG